MSQWTAPEVTTDVSQFSQETPSPVSSPLLSNSPSTPPVVRLPSFVPNPASSLPQSGGSPSIPQDHIPRGAESEISLMKEEKKKEKEKPRDIPDQRISEKWIGDMREQVERVFVLPIRVQRKNGAMEVLMDVRKERNTVSFLSSKKKDEVEKSAEQLLPASPNLLKQRTTTRLWNQATKGCVFLCDGDNLPGGKTRQWMSIPEVVEGESFVELFGEKLEYTPSLDTLRKNSLFQENLKTFCKRIHAAFMAEFLRREIRHTTEACTALQVPSPTPTAIGIALNRDPASLPRTMVELPPSPPEPEIAVIDPNGKEYKKVMSHVRSHGEAIRSIRRAKVKARAHLFDKKHKANGSSIVQPLFHGTKDTWRGTAIAYKGFDLNIQLNGRAHGNGAYSTKDWNYAMGYCGPTGSVLMMRGLVGGKTKTTGTDPIYVYPDVECILVEYIIDLGDVDDKDKIYEKAVREAREKQEKGKALMEEQVKNFLQTLVHRTLKTYRNYLDLLQRFESNPDQEVSAILRESNQSRANLPIYAHKKHLVELMKENQVLIVGAETGSGKSTQLPQYLADEVIPQAKKILVLQPRRLNAKTLAERVAEERGTPVGKEVGWEVGRGGGVSTPNSRIIFMTHGLFVCRILASSKMEDVGAIVIDEAHERSLQVDMVFGMMRQALEKGSNIKVIVASATLKEEAHHFLDFLLGSPQNNIRGYVVPALDGMTFPVHTEYRPLVEPDEEEVGCGGMNAIRLAAAVQTASELLGGTDQGNILIFVAGTGDANFGRDQLRSEMSEDASGDARNQFNYKDHLLGNKSKSTQVFALFSDLPEDEKDVILHCKDRMVVFATNVAETGVTLPDVRYVIDTGMNREGGWNEEFEMKLLTSEWVTKSSADQRKGRAGRVGSGYCVRLYEEKRYQEMKSIKQPAIVQSSLQSTVLSLHAYIARARLNMAVKDFPLLTPINEDLLQNTSEQLERMGCLQADTSLDGYSLTDIGEKIADLGLNPRLGRFLAECCSRNVGCDGARIVALIQADAHRFLVRNDASDEQKHELKKLTHPSGEHLTLLRVYNEACKRGINWRISVGLRLESVDEVGSILNNLFTRMHRLGMPTLEEKDEDKRDEAVIQALAIAYFDQMCVSRSPEEAGSKYIRCLDKEEQRNWNKDQEKFAEAARIEGVELSVESEPVVRWSVCSPFAGCPKPNNEKGLLIYHTLMQTDLQGQPSISLCSFISEDVANNAANKLNWVNVEQFHQMVKDLKRVTEVFDFNACGNKAKKVKEEVRNLLQSKWPSVHVRNQGQTEEDRNRMVVTLREDQMPPAKHLITEKMNSYSQTVLIKLQDAQANDEKAVRTAVNKVRKETQELYKKEVPGCSIQIQYKPDITSVEITVDGAAKRCIPAIVGRMQLELHRGDIYTCDPTGMADSSGEVQTGWRIQQLLAMTNRQPANDRASCCLRAAYLIFDRAKCTLYGGFVRDYLIGGDINRVKDIDSSVSTSIAQSFRVLKGLENEWDYTLKGIDQPSCPDRDWKIIYFHFGCGVTVEADLILLKKPANTVDASVNNVQLTAGGILKKKVNCHLAAAHSLSDIMQQIQKKEFHLYMSWGQSPGYCVTRASKLLEKGFRCLSGIPPAHKGRFDARYHRLIM